MHYPDYGIEKRRETLGGKLATRFEHRIGTQAANNLQEAVDFGVLGLVLLGTVGIVAEGGMYLYAGHQANNRVEEMFAEALASNRLSLDVQTIDGRTVNLNTLPPKERALTIANAGKIYTDGNSRDASFTKEVAVAVSDTSNGYICTLSVDPKQLDMALKGKGIPQLTIEQATKYAEALGRKCGLDDKEIEAMKVNLISTIKISASPQGPYSTVATNGVMVEQLGVAPKTVTRG
jgi:hypothetical protein